MTLSHPLARLRPLLWFGALLALIVFIEHLVTTLPAFSQRPALPAAVTFDLLVFVPGLFYFLVVRRLRLPVTSVVGAFGACVALGYWLIPVGQQQYLRPASHLLPLLEVGVVGWALVNLRRISRAYCGAREQHADFPANLSTAFEQVLGYALAPLVSEISMFRYALLGWWVRLESREEETAFTSHRESGFTALVVVGCFAVGVETATVHLLASHWSPVLANWLLVLDAYGLLFLMGHGHAVRLRPTLLATDALTLRVGFVWQISVPRAALVSIEPLRDAPAADVLNLSKLLFTAPNLLLTFAEPVVVAGPYGIRRTTRRVAVYLDQPQRFIAGAGLAPTSPTH
ncbi:hypothetical protein IC235_13075 [Hymenobacter sp. BT664]|uniref:Beta-carotene 15,15'-monooxygenase n=1 Tax=Hymenobacter montanus TaxID=2771359 RepID=A0A927GK64_9BACT|nr:hypothetical protein [Hymenobacter montanus]MBD2768821.1 hypothetical protein [Hymenobacter montanus]